MPIELRLPDIGEGVAEGEVKKWLVKAGDEVEADQPLVEVMTDKVTVEIPSPSSGTVLKIMADEGQVVKVGTPLIVIGEKGETPPRVGGVEAEARAPERAAAVAATPSTRRLARELGVDIARVPGTGPAGRVTEDDIRRFARAKPAAAVAERPEERVPIRGIRRRMAEKMTASHRAVAQSTIVDEVDVSELVALREKLREELEQRGLKLTYLPFVIKAVVEALKDHPYLNASIDDARGEVVLKKYYNIGFAVATSEGLIVPVVKDADKKGTLQLARNVKELAQKAREGKLGLDEIRSGTFSITSLGALGGLHATPIINHPEAAILGVHRIERKPVARGEEIKIRDIANLSLSFDHRVIDGAMAAGFIARVKELLEDPRLLLPELT